MKIKIITLSLVFVLSIPFLGGCQGARTLKVESTYPENGAVEIPMESDISIHIDFSKPINQTATAKALTIYPETSYEIFWESNNTVLRLVSLTLLPTTQYQVNINTKAEAEDRQNLAGEYMFSFETGIKPDV